MEDKEIKYVTINNTDYIIMNELEKNNSKYLFLVNELDEADFLIQKLKNNMIEPIDSKELYLELFQEFAKKNN